MARRLKTRFFLKALLVLGILLMLFGPFMRIRNEGAGGPPGPVSVSREWQTVSYLLIPVGAGLAIASGFGLVAIDWRQQR